MNIRHHDQEKILKRRFSVLIMTRAMEGLGGSIFPTLSIARVMNYRAIYVLTITLAGLIIAEERPTSNKLVKHPL